MKSVSLSQSALARSEPPLRHGSPLKSIRLRRLDIALQTDLHRLDVRLLDVRRLLGGFEGLGEDIDGDQRLALPELLGLAHRVELSAETEVSLVRSPAELPLVLAHAVHQRGE